MKQSHLLLLLAAVAATTTDVAPSACATTASIQTNSEKYGGLGVSYTLPERAQKLQKAGGEGK